jgi:hypothetical protein
MEALPAHCVPVNYLLLRIRTAPLMITSTPRSEMQEHDAVMSWLQNCELKDRRLGSARSSRARAVEVWSAIDRMQEKAYDAFPLVPRSSIDGYVRKYIDPSDRAIVRPVW